MTKEEAILWLKVINTKEFGWDEFALQESQREIRERCEQGVREAIDMAIEALSADAEQGEWVDSREYPWSKCNKCGYTITCYQEEEFRYCPSCGARMKGGDE